MLSHFLQANARAAQAQLESALASAESAEQEEARQAREAQAQAKQQVGLFCRRLDVVASVLRRQMRLYLHLNYKIDQTMICNSSDATILIL